MSTALWKVEAAVEERETCRFLSLNTREKRERDEHFSPNMPGEKSPRGSGPFVDRKKSKKFRRAPASSPPDWNLHDI